MDEEEIAFAKTIDRGEKVFEQYKAQAEKSGSKELRGKDVWRLYDTYGFPLDLTHIMAEESGLKINQAEVSEAEAAAKEASKGGGKKNVQGTVKLDVHDIGALEKDTSVPKTDDAPKYCKSCLYW